MFYNIRKVISVRNNQFFYLFNLPRKKMLQMVYLAVISTLCISLLKLLLHGTPLRSSKQHVPSPSSSLIPVKLKHDSNLLLDLPAFQWMLNNASVCQLNRYTSRLMVILVHTSRNHFAERKAIRETWGSMTGYKNWSIRVVFLLGQAYPARHHLITEKEIDSDIQKEFLNHGDLVMGSFVDSYRNLSYKHLMGYKWILEYCEEPTFVWKVDDDIFIDILALVDMRETELNGGNPVDLYCPAVQGSKPRRDKRKKWYVSNKTWPFESYPTYCSGMAYGINLKWINLIYSVSTLTKVIWIDDIFVTGVLIHIVQQKFHLQPTIKFTWPYVTFNYDPEKTTFCLENEHLLDEKRRFGIFVRLKRGSFLIRESACLWDKVLADKGFMRL